MECVPTVPITMVWPSPGDLATLSAPMLPPAPGRLSTTTGKPSWAFSLNKRARMSGAPPEGKVTTKRKGLVGKAWASALVALKAPRLSSKRLRPNCRFSGEVSWVRVGVMRERKCLMGTVGLLGRFHFRPRGRCCAG